MRVELTTVVLTADHKVYNLGEGQFPPQPHDNTIRLDKYRIIDAYVCTLEEAERLKGKSKKKGKKK